MLPNKYVFCVASMGFLHFSLVICLSALLQLNSGGTKIAIGSGLVHHIVIHSYFVIKFYLMAGKMIL